jgi:hypothetical protein
MVSTPCTTASAPTGTTTASTSDGCASISAQIRASSWILPRDSSRIRRACSSYCRYTARSRPNALMVRMPPADSSTSVVSSPCWSCTLRDWRRYCFSNRYMTQTSGVVSSTTSTASGQ